MTDTKTTETTETKIPKRLLLRKRHDITAFASTDQTRLVLQSVHYNGAKKLLEACDGKVMIRLPVETTEEFPPIAKLDTLPETNGSNCVIPLKPFLKALGNIPKSKLPILESVRLDVEAPKPGGADAPTFHLTTNDLDSTITVSGRSVEGNFPNLEQIIPTAEPTLEIAFAAEVLLRIAQYSNKHGACQPRIKLQFTDSESPIRFIIPLEDGQEATGVAMPMRLS